MYSMNKMTKRKKKFFSHNNYIDLVFTILCPYDMLLVYAASAYFCEFHTQENGGQYAEVIGC